MHRLLVVFIFATACVATLAQGAAARNPGGRDYGGAIFSAGGSGTDGTRVGPRTAAISLGALFRVSDDTGLPDTLAPWELPGIYASSAAAVVGGRPRVREIRGDAPAEAEAFPNSSS